MLRLFVELVNALLSDDHGISQTAYEKLVLFATLLDPYPKEDMRISGQINTLADATDGRFYFPEGQRLSTPDPLRVTRGESAEDADNLYRVVTGHLEDGFANGGLEGEMVEAIVTLLRGDELIVSREEELGSILAAQASNLPDRLDRRISWC